MSLTHADVTFINLDENSVSLWNSELEKFDLSNLFLQIDHEFNSEFDYGFWLERARKLFSEEKNVGVRLTYYDPQKDELFQSSTRLSCMRVSSFNDLVITYNPKNRKCFFLDRDGIINEDSGYINKSEDVHFCSGLFELLKWLQVEGYDLVIVTNQSGVGRGYYSEQEVLALHKWMDQQLRSEGIKILDWMYSPFHPESEIALYKKLSYSRKPSPGMILAAQKKYQIDLKASYMIGDKVSDRIKELDIETFFIQGHYDLKNEAPLFLSHEALLKYLKENI